MPAASTTSTQAIKTEREERLLQALKTHILKERQRKKEEHEAEVEEERQRREREARERQDVMTLGETREQIMKLDQKLKELKNQKQQLFLQLKKVLNEDENRKKQQQQKDSEILSMHNLPPPQNSAPPHGQIFLPPRQSHPQILQKGGPVAITNPPIKRSRSPSPPPAPGYFKSAAYSPPKHDDSRRSAEVARVLWNKPQQYQTPPGTLFYQTTPSTQPDSRVAANAAAQSIMYPSYNPNLNIPPPIRQNYHIEIPQPPPPNPQAHSQKNDQQQKNAHVYHINLDLPLMTAQGGPPGPGPNQPPNLPPQHKSQVTMEKVQDRSGYHVEVKLDPSQQIVHTSLLPGIPIHPNVMQIPTNQSQNSKTGGSITQGYSSRSSNHNQQPPPSMAGQPPPQSQIHYPRRLF